MLRNAARLLASGLALSALMNTLVIAAPGDTELVSTRADVPGQVTAENSSEFPLVSANGSYVAFSSSAVDLVAGDSNNAEDAFIFNQTSGRVELISVSSSGVAGNARSEATSISSDGRYVVFWSEASNLVPGDTNNNYDIFVRDRQTATTARVNVSSSGSQTNAFTAGGAISGDGRYVAFDSVASNLVTDDTNAKGDVFVRDLVLGTTTRISVSSSGAQGDSGTAGGPEISADGRYVAFSSLASNLVAGDTNNAVDIFVRDRQAGTTTRVNVASSGTQSNGSLAGFSISADGQLVAFGSYASDLVAGDTNSTSDVFVHDMQSGTTTRISLSSDGTQGDSFNQVPAISGDGRLVAFYSASSNLVPGDTNGQPDILVHDRQLGTTTLVSVASTGAQGDSRSEAPSLSADGRYIAFHSLASNLVSGDTNEVDDVFVRDRQTSVTTLISRGLDSLAGGASTVSSVSTDGRYVAFSSDSRILVPDDTNGRADIFMRDRQTNVMERVNVSSSGVQANADSDGGWTDGSGRSVIFASSADNLVPDDSNLFADVFVRDRQTSTTRRVSVGASGTQGNDSSKAGGVSRNGRYVLFSSRASNLVADDTNAREDVFVYDLQTSTPQRVSITSGGVEANDFSQPADINGDGRYVLMTSYASNLVAGDTNGVPDLFVRDRQAGTTERVDVDSAGGQANAFALEGAVSDDGRYVAFSTYASNLVSGDTNGGFDIFVRDRQLGTTERISVNSSGAQADRDSLHPRISADGRYVAFQSDATNLVLGDTNAAGDIFVRDRQTGTTERVSIAGNGAQADDSSGYAWLTADGRFLSFFTYASNLGTAGKDSPGTPDIYIHERSVGAAGSSYSLTPSAAGFGNQAINSSSAARAFTLTNNGSGALAIASIQLVGTNAGMFNSTNNCGSLVPAGASCIINVLFRPTSTGPKSGTLRVTGGNNVVRNRALSGTGVAATASFTLKPATVDFGSQRRNSNSAARVVTLKNSGDVPVSITSVTKLGTNPGMFTVSNNCGTMVPVGASCTISIVFRPTSLGAKSASLRVQAGGGAGQKSVALSGTGTS